MKTLIWIGTCSAGVIAFSIIKIFLDMIKTSTQEQVLLFGLLSGVIAAICVGVSCWAARKLCKKYDKNRIVKQATAEGLSVREYCRRDLSEEFLEKLDNLCQKASREKVEVELEKCVSKGKITKQQYKRLLFDIYENT